MVFMKAILLHTKGEDNNLSLFFSCFVTNLRASRRTLIIDWEDDDPLFCLLDHLIFLALRDDAFQAESAKHFENTFWVTLPRGKKSLTLKWNREILDFPVFCEPIRHSDESGSSPPKPLNASTWIRNLKRLRRKTGLQHSFTQYGLRRGLLNVVNSMSFRFISIWKCFFL